MRISTTALIVLLAISLPALAMGLTIDRPTGDEPVPVPFVVEGTAEAGAVLVLEVDGEFVTVFRSDAEGRFSVPVSRSASEVTVRFKSDPGRSASVAIVTEGEFERTTRNEEGVDGKGPSEEDDEEPTAPPPPDSEPEEATDDALSPEVSEIPTTAEVPPPPEELEKQPSDPVRERDEPDDPDASDDSSNPRTSANDLPPGYIAKCHPKSLGSGVHCHVVPHEAMPTFLPFRPGLMVAQYFGAILGAVVVAVGGGGATYLALAQSADPLTAESVGFVVGAMLLWPGAALGVWGTGQLFGGRGNFLWTLGGMLVGSAGGAIMSYHLSADRRYDGEIEQYDTVGRKYGANSMPPAAPTMSVVTVRF